MSGLDFCLALCRFVHFAALMPLAGDALLQSALAPAGGAASRRPRLQAWLAIATAVTALLWLMLLAAAFTGDLHAMTSPQTLSLVLDQTAFGRVWRLRLILAAAMLAAAFLAMAGFSWSRRYVMPVLAMTLLVSLGLTGHAADGGLATELAQALHLAAGGLWLGGLIVLLRLALTGDDGARGDTGLATALTRFSRLGPWLVAAIALSGFVNAAALLRGPGDLLVSGYGRTLSLKLVLVVGMLACAANNRFRLAPKLVTAPAPTRHALIRSLVIEMALGLGVLAVTALLGMLGPPGD
ncbi:MAG TPA: copper homeostasis membrane protein CopD [Stellaceae bacterium]|nr:copper homeostasis membrane protein CopD [Stellaceae bacterium]